MPGSNPSPIIIVNTQRFNNSPSAGTAMTADAAQGSLLKTRTQLAAMTYLRIKRIKRPLYKSGFALDPHRQ